MKRLTKLANKYNTDKGTEYWFAHGFTDFYGPYFAKYESPTILEIGTAEGGSAKMLNEFFDGNCTIYTIDIDKETGKNVEGYDNIKFFKVDCSNEDEINKFLNEDAAGVDFDIVIEDASHNWAHQMMAMYFFGKRVKKDGIYIVEDLHTSYTKDYPESESPLYFLNFFENGYGLYDYEVRGLTERIKDVIIYNRYNERNCDFFKHRSITSIITFR